MAERTNVETTQILSSFAESIPFVFISSDLVFDGKKGAYVESDSPNPLSKYGETMVSPYLLNGLGESDST